ncbi:efflux RND transporter periplasmic adaptor subunit [Gemmata sp. JC717]|uniref:efflux RND transporter periplasmic adaptor subunit n=1 Tax=Gemmata algarum TaxID=2975278 RepID=UPI0021BA7CD9|nr:efflux RND transporter periplasmic adaptor subunit [Gemmata algarum]MDY3556471.1 efflux RND transporter periplasmic adaptor subunit [Gemmata algarum]
MTNRQKLATWLAFVPIVVCVGMFARAGLAALAQSRTPPAAAPPPVTVLTDRLVPVTLVGPLNYSGTVKEWQRVELSFRVGGTVSELLRVGTDRAARDLHEGDRFPHGTVLARLDPADYRRDRALAAERLSQAEAKLVSARADAESADSEFGRARRTFAGGAGSRSDFDSAKSRSEVAAASVSSAAREVDAAKVQLAQADANLGYCELTMPYAEGTVAGRSVEANERVSAGQKLFQIVDLSSVRIAFGVSDTVVGRLALGGAVGVTTDALPDERFVGTITKIAPTADAQTRTYLVEVRVTEPRGLRPGMIATATLTERKSATLLPLVAVTRETTGAGRLVAYKVVRDGDRLTARVCPVELDGVVDARAAIRPDTPGGLRPGDEVVTGGAPRLYDGAAVKPVAAGAAEVGR